jgi:hypothetical protein
VGVASLATAPLCVADICALLRPRYPLFERLHSPCRALFAIVFLILRVAIWPCVSVRFWMDALWTLVDGTARLPFATWTFLVANLLLTGLQLVWGRKVVLGLVKALRAGKKPRAKAA